MEGRGHGGGGGQGNTDEITQFVLTCKREKIFLSFSNDSGRLHSPPSKSRGLVFLLRVKDSSLNGHHITHIGKDCSPFCFLQSKVHAKLHQKKVKWGFLEH